MVIDADKIILTRPEKGINLRKVASLVNVLFFWGVTVYLMRSLFTLFGWLIMYFIFGHAFSDDGLEGMIRTITHFYLPLIIVAAIALWMWAGYNRIRYGGFKDKRRVHPAPLSMEEMCGYTKLPMSKIENMRDAKIVICHFDAKCELKDVDCHSLPDDDEVNAAIPPMRHAAT